MGIKTVSVDMGALKAFDTQSHSLWKESESGGAASATYSLNRGELSILYHGGEAGQDGFITRYDKNSEVDSQGKFVPTQEWQAATTHLMKVHDISHEAATGILVNLAAFDSDEDQDGYYDGDDQRIDISDESLLNIDFQGLPTYQVLE